MSKRCCGGAGIHFSHAMPCYHQRHLNLLSVTDLHVMHTMHVVNCKHPYIYMMSLDHKRGEGGELRGTAMQHRLQQHTTLHGIHTVLKRQAAIYLHIVTTQQGCQQTNLMQCVHSTYTPALSRALGPFLPLEPPSSIDCLSGGWSVQLRGFANFGL